MPDIAFAVAGHFTGLVIVDESVEGLALVRPLGGDFFESVPEADLYLLRYIIHDWDDESCLRILRNVRNGLQAGGRVMVIDAVVGDIGGPPAVPGMDINMMVVLGGRERTIAEFKALFEGAGLRFVKATPMSTPTAIIEAVAS